MPKFTIAQRRYRETLEIRTVEADTALDAVMKGDDEGEIETHVLRDEVTPRSDLIPAEQATDDWKGRIIAQNTPAKPAIEKIASPEHAKQRGSGGTKPREIKAG